MRGKLVIYLGLIFVFCGGQNSHAQEREYIYDHFNISNGLISDNVFKIFVDREGSAWIVTYNGLQRYNGYEYETYTSSSHHSGGLSSNFVKDMFEDRDGSLIVVLDDGIDIFDRYSSKFTNLLSDLPFAEIRRNEINRIASAAQDRTGAVWVNCNNHLVRIDSAKKDLVVYSDEYSGRFVINRDSTILWIITDDAIKRFDPGKNLLTITNIEDIPGPVPIDRLNTIYYDSNSICWLGTSQGLFVLDEEKLQILDPGRVLPGILKSHGTVLGQDITALYEDFEKDLWFVSGTVLYRMDRQSGKVQILQHELENYNTILEEQITGIHGNQTGVVWITYLNEGFTRINIRRNNFRSYRVRPNQDRSLGGNTVRSIYKDRSGYIWLGLYNDGLDRIDPVTGTVSHFRSHPEQNGSVCSNYISSLFLDKRERLWVGSHDNGLCYAGQVYQQDLTFHTPGFLNANDEIYHIQDDSLGRIWIGTRTGLGVYDYEYDTFHWILKNHNVQSFIIDRYTIWIASWDHGLCKLVFDQDQFNSGIPRFDSTASLYYPTLETNGSEETTSFSNAGGLRNGISIYQDQQKNIWLGTYDGGLVKAIEADGEIIYKTYDVSIGAPGNAVYGVTGDHHGNIWTSTEHGIGKFDPVTEQFENYYREDGLLSNYFMWKSYFKAPDGEILFGSVDGLNTFYPDELIRDTLSPKVFISEIRIQNQLVEYGDTVNGDVLLDRHITYKDTLILNHRNRNFSFRFYTTGHINPQRVKYSHMLVGFDEDWIINEDGNRSASYNYLSPGVYFFRVRATDREADWYGSYEEKMLILLPPWWKTSLAYGVYFLLIVGLIFLITHSLIRFLALKHELSLNEKLHQSKLMFFTNISHEFKTPLSLIKAPLNDILNEKELSPHNRKNLQVARKNADNLLNLVNELMEFRRTDTGNSKLRAEQIELTGFISEVASQFECIAEQQGVHFYYNIPDEPLKLWVDRKKFRRIVNNLLENALKYTREEGLVTLSIIRNPSRYSFKPNYHTLQLNRAKKQVEYIGILVSDSGVGISRDSLPRIFDRFYQIEAELASYHIGSGIGLALVKNLVLMHQGEIRVASERGEGTEILVLLPLGDRHLKDDEKTVAMEESTYQEVIEPEQRPDNSRKARVDDPVDIYGLPCVLLVEDHEELRQYLKEQLSEEFRVLEAANGEEGLKILAENRVDLIITDWIMPEMDGTAFIKEVRSDHNISTLPIILLTAKDELKERQDGLDMGADQVIPKPFNMQLLRSQVRRTIENNRTRLRKFSLESMENLVEIHETRDAHFMGEVERIIKNHIRDNALNAGVIAMEVGVSRTALYDRIKSITGQTIGEYIQQIRLKHAIKLMLYDKVPVSEVYLMVGISSSSYLIRLFKKYYKTTPKEYIRKYLKTASN